MPAGGNKRVDQVTFFDIWEDMNKLSTIPPQDPILKKSVISLQCLTTTDSARVDGCNFRTVL